MAESRYEYEREIDELLQRLERDDRAPIPFRPRRNQRWAGASRRLKGLLTLPSAVERLIAASVGLLLVTLLLGLLAPRVAWFVGVAAVVCFATALALSAWQGATGRGSPGRERYPEAAQGRVEWGELGEQFRRWMRRFRR
jgi:hypothetical protein